MTASQAGKESTFNAFADAASPATLYGRRQSTCSGLTWGYYGGRVTLRDGTNTAIANGTLTLSASATNYVEVNPATGAVSTNTTAFTSGYWPLYSVVTGTATATSYTDYRASAVAGASVADVACRTITVTGEGATTATLGSELVTNGTFTGDASGWTLGTNWAYGTNNVILTNSGGSGTLSQNISVTSGVDYLVSWTQSHSIASNAQITPSIGAVSGTKGCIGSISGTAQIIRAGATGSLPLAFTVTDLTTTGTVTIDTVSVKQITQYAAIETIKGSAADATPAEIRATVSLSNYFNGLNCGSRNVTGYSNWAAGPGAFANNVSGYQCFAAGLNALGDNTTGGNNFAAGPNAMRKNTSGYGNFGGGANTLYWNTTGDNIVAIGNSAVRFNQTGSGLTGVGAAALYDNTIADYNTAVGYNTGRGITTGGKNTIIGAQVTGLSSSLTDNIILATGQGTIRAQFDATNWNFGSKLLPTADNTHDIGSASYGWKEIFADNGTINTSDARRKTPVNELSPAEIGAAKQLAAEIGSFQFLAAVEEKGDNARQHIGMTVQRAIEIMTAHGLDPFKYSFICHDQWGDEYREVTVNTDEKRFVIDPLSYELTEVAAEPIIERRLIRAAGGKYSFRTHELLLFIAAGFHARITALENKAL